MLKSLFLLLGIIFLVFFITICPYIPKNIYCFLDIGTYRAPSYFIEVNSLQTYGQTFVSNFNNLFKISIFVPPKNLNSDVFFYLKETPKDKDSLFNLKLSPKDFHPPHYDFYAVPADAEVHPSGFHVHIPFPLIENSKGKIFYFYLECPSCPVGKGLKIGIWKKPYYEALTKGTAFLNHQEIKGFLAFRTFNTWTSPYSILWKEIQDRLLQDTTFLFMYSSILIVILISYLWLQWTWRKS